MELIVGRMLRFVKGYFFRVIWNWKELFFTYYCMFRVCFNGKVWWSRFMFLSFLILFLIGMDSMMFLLEINLCRLKLFFLYIVLVFLISVIIFLIDVIDFNLSFTWLKLVGIESSFVSLLFVDVFNV